MNYLLEPEDPVQQHINAIERQQEIIADISFAGGSYWERLNEDARTRILDQIEGSRGLMQRFVAWAVEFDAAWEALDPGADRDKLDNYIGEVDDFAHQKMNALVAECRLA